MSKQNIDWSNLGFGYLKTDYLLRLPLQGRSVGRRRAGNRRKHHPE